MTAAETDRLGREMDEATERLRTSARAAMGMRRDENAPPLGELIRTSGASWYAVLALGLLVVVDQFQGYAFFVLGPEISRALGISRNGLAGLAALKTLAISMAAFPMAALVQRQPRRGLVSIVTGFAWAALTALTGFVTSALGMAGILVADGASSGSVQAIHQPLLIDSYPPEGRVRVLSLYHGLERMGTVIAPLLVAVLSAGFGLTWRGVFLVSGLVALTAAVFSLRLRDPGYGTWDAARVRRAVQEETGRGDGVQADDDVQLGFFENVHRLFLIPTVRRLLAVYAVLGMLVIPLYTYLFFFLDERWAMGPAQRGVFLAVMAVFAIGGVALFAKRGEELYRSDMSRLAVAGSSVLGGGIVALAIALFIPSFPLMVAFFGVAFALFAVVNPLLSALLLSIVRPRMRPHAAALTGIFLAGVGGLLGLLLLGGIDRRFGTTGAILSIALPGLVAALVLRTVAKTVDRDFDRMVDELVEEEEVRGIVAAGQHLPLIACRGLDFHYGSVQVLFHIDFTVDDGEMVALLGTNGAGKSTLLRAISGLGLPTAGTIRLRGSDITYVDTIRRRQLGIAQVPGGRAVFGPLSVVENLRLFGYTFGRDKKALDLAIDESFAAFPALAARRNQAAATLSGGEQQMLGLCQAFVLRPQLLLIDELSLGLAPKIVGELLDMLKRINVAGAAVVLVEQSVNIALSVVEHVYFMEKGEIRFDGRARDLLGERDLLRSVFLEGAAKGLAR